MLRKSLVVAFLVAVVTASIPASAQFLAADLLYIPGAAHSDGENGSRWRSDLYITNVEEEAEVDLAIVYLPTGNSSNAARFTDRSTWLGGREADGFGIIDETLAGIPPGGTVVLRDPIGEYWPNDQGTANFGGLVIFAYEADSLEDDGTRVLRNVIVNSRVFTPFTHYQPDPDNEGEFLEVEGTYGQTMPGVPWYNLADPSAVDSERDFSFQILTGAGLNDEFRYNVGILNASDPLTSISIVIQPFQGDGEPFLDDNDLPITAAITMQPLAHIQYNNIFESLFNLEQVPDDASIDIAFNSWASGSSAPVVGMTVYGTMIDNATNDSTAVLPAFAFPYDVDCLWTSDGEAKSSPSGIRRISKRPIEIPSR